MKYFFLIYSFCSILNTNAQNELTSPKIGMVQDYENDELLEAQGYKYLIESTQKLFSPQNVSEEQFQIHLQNIGNLALPLFGSNLFIPGNLKIVGPEVDEEALLSYVEVVFQRGEAAGIEMVIWGSCGSRQLPEGFSRKKAKQQFISMARKISDRAKKYNIVLALESLNSTECNFINTLAEALEVVKAVDRKNFRLNADIYHMLMEGESPEVIVTTKDYLVYSEIAEKEGRTPPGVNDEDFIPFLTALKEVGYEGNIMIESRWKDLEDQGSNAYEYLRSQIDEVYNK